MSHSSTTPIKKGQIIELEISAAAFEGKGLGRIGDFAIFVKHTAPGDRVRARIIRKKKSFAEGILLEILEASKHRIVPRCRHAGLCGGCNWQHIPYPLELDYKAAHVADHFQRIGGFSQLPVQPAVGARSDFYYRNKMEFTFGARRWLTDEEIASSEPPLNKDFALGLHIPGRYDRILNLEECHLQDPVSWRILDTVREYALQHSLQPYNTHLHQGYLRNLVIRNALHTSDLMLTVVTREEEETKMRALSEHILEKFPEITTLLHLVNHTRSPSTDTGTLKVIHGPGYIRERLGEYEFKIDSRTFFQTNTLQAEALYEVVLSCLSENSYPVIHDMYCGIGTLTLYVSRKADRMVGIELNPAAVEKARENAIENNTPHVRFVQGDMKDVYNDQLVEEYGRPDVIISDPPRAGMHEQVIRKILALEPKKIIYVSCNSATQARDASILCEKYRLDRLVPVDMFPRTYHMESVAEFNLVL